MTLLGYSLMEIAFLFLFVLTSGVVVVGFLMVFGWIFPSLKALLSRVPRSKLILITIVGVIFLIYGFLHFFSVMLSAMLEGYTLLGLILLLIQLIAGERSKTLFEPEEEDNE